MILYIVMLLFIFVLLLTAAYLRWSVRHGQFLVFNFNHDPKLNRLFTVTSIALLIISIIGIIILFTLNKNFNFITLILATLTISIFSISFSKYNK